MADNIALPPSGVTAATDDVGGVHYQRVKIDLGGDGAASPLLRGEQARASSVPVTLNSDSDWMTNPSANFTRPANTTAYAAGDIVANSTTAGSVVALSWTAPRVSAGSFIIRRAKLKKTATSVTNAAFRLHMFASDPAASSGIANGDNGAFSVNDAAYLGSFDIIALQAMRDCAIGFGTPTVGGDIQRKLASGQTVYGLVEVLAAYTPASGEVFTVEIEVLREQ